MAGVTTPIVPSTGARLGTSGMVHMHTRFRNAQTGKSDHPLQRAGRVSNSGHVVVGTGGTQNIQSSRGSPPMSSMMAPAVLTPGATQPISTAATKVMPSK